MLRWTVRRGFGVGPTLMAAVLTLGLAHVSMFAQAQAQDAPFDGVAEDRVQLRSGAGNSYYVVGDLPKGAEARVEEIIHGWSKIAPPPGMFSYISKSFVDSTDNKTGKVNSDKAPVRAASPNGPGDSFRTHAMLKTGDTVQIVGEDGNFYRITPPPGAFVFAPPGAIRRKVTGAAPVVAAPAAPVTPAPAAAAPKPAAPTNAAPAPATVRPTAPTTPAPAPAAAAPRPATTLAPAPAATPAPTPAPVPAPTVTDTTGLVTPSTADVIEPTKSPEATPTGTGTPVEMTTGTPMPDAPKPAPTRTRTTRSAAPAAEAPAPAPRPTPAAGVGGLPGAISPRVQQAEARYGEVLNEPLEKQPLSELISTYESLHSDPTIPPLDRRIVAARLAQLRRNLELATALRSINQTQTDIQNAPPIRIEPQSSRVLNNGPDARYTAVGLLLASSVFNGQNMPTLFRIVDPATGRTVAYVRPVSALSPLEWAAMLGKTVGVMGESRNDPALKLRIIDVSKVDLLQATEPARQSAPAPEK